MDEVSNLSSSGEEGRRRKTSDSIKYDNDTLNAKIMSSTLTWRPTGPNEVEAEVSRYQNIDGPQINALQVVSEALDIPQDEPDDENSQHGVEDGVLTTSNASFTFGSRTVVAADNEVSNGFVKSGRSLPYVFEANESGMRKRSSKILPVCAVCGKRFVCVTTMKRHLVTHTGEKPFSCKVCGKQYTQKGNLRVHERTHRNDRPFECNICHQKFYRKEPMQKHQWRQHGIVHFKSRPTPEGTPVPDTSKLTVVTTPAVVAAATVTSSGGAGPSVAAPRQVKLEPPRPLISVRPAPPTSYTALVDSMKARGREESPYNRSVLDGPGNPPEPPIAHQHNHIEVPKYIHEPVREPAPPQPQHYIKTQPHQASITIKSEASTPVNKDMTFSYSSILNEPTIQHQQQQQQQQPNSHLLIIQAEPTEQVVEQQAHLPPKLKMKMAYQREQQVELEHQQMVSSQQHQEQNQVVEIKSLDSELNEMKINQNNQAETVDCQCKTCGNTFSVVDPYNFKCNNCHVKYTSLPTHLIADPLQCIGCCAVFPHKPALKAHQMVPDKERPFRCCKCGYGFRQKAHLQKHQWRIHRRKLEPDPNVKEAEAFFEVIQRARDQSSERATITMQDIINKSVEKSIEGNPQNLMKTSSKYYSEVLGLEYDPKSSTPGSSTSEEDDSRDQPLDLSPAKKQQPQPVAAVAPEVISKPTSSLVILPFQPESQQSLSSTSKVQVSVRETNPLLSKTPTHPHHQNEANDTCDYPPPAWKKQKTSSTPALTITATHATLPPITGLQKPMSLVTMKNYKHSSWITESHEAVQQLQQPPVAKHSENNTLVRSQLELLRSSNARTV